MNETHDILDVDQSCIICDSEMRYYITTKDYRYQRTPDEDFRIFKCSECGLESTKIGEAELDDYYPKDYTPHTIAKREDYSCFAKVYEQYLTGIESLLGLPEFEDFVASQTEEGILLDVGCGSGALMNKLDSRGFKVSGVDVADASREVVHERYGYDIDVGFLPELAYEEDIYDVVTFEHSFEHIDQPEKYVQTVREILRPNGRVVLELPNPQSVAARVFSEYWVEREAPRHVYNWPPKALIKLFEKYNFQVESIKHSGSTRAFRNSLRRYLVEEMDIDTPRVDLLDLPLSLPMLLSKACQRGERYQISFVSS